MKLDLKLLSWIILAIGLILYLGIAMDDSLHHKDLAEINFVQSSFTLMITLFIWTCCQILSGQFNIKQFSWVLSIAGYIFAITVFCYFGIDQKTGWFSFNGLFSASACAIAMFSTLPLLILYYKNNKSVENTSDNPTVKTRDPLESQVTDDDNWEPASIEDLHSGEYELKN